MKHFLVVGALGASSLFGASPAAAPKPAALKKIAPDIEAVISGGSDDLSRTVKYAERDIPTIHTRLHYTTVFVLPESERVMDLLCGDKENWTIDGAAGTNFAYVKPGRAGAKTNLNLVTASGNVYSFLLTEGGQPDLKIFVTPKDTGMVKALVTPPKWVTASELEASRREVELAKQDAQAVRVEAEKSNDEVEAHASKEIAEFEAKFPASLKHDYVIGKKHHDADFGIRAIAHSTQFTYIWASPRELPTLYEVKDGKPSLINFEFQNGVYIVPKIIDSGYLVVGKAKIEFKRETAAE